jgi:transcriptional regulator with XRE-family HTH domain
MTTLIDFNELMPKDPERLARIAAREAELENAIQLCELRKRAGKSQQEVASRLGVTQKRISEIEHSGNLEFETLRKFVAALGGEIEVRAVFEGTEPIPFTLAS